jgi:hypothetical protein
MSKEIIEYSGKLIIFETILPVTEVIFRLERELTLVDPLAFKSKDELVDIITQATADADFVCVSTIQKKLAAHMLNFLQSFLRCSS